MVYLALESGMRAAQEFIRSADEAVSLPERQPGGAVLWHGRTIVRAAPWKNVRAGREACEMGGRVSTHVESDALLRASVLGNLAGARASKGFTRLGNSLCSPWAELAQT